MIHSQPRRRDRGQSLVEFSLIFPLAMLLFMALFDFGRAVYGLNAVSNAAREGTRTAIVNQNWSDIRQRASDQATGLGIDTSLVACSAENQPASDSGVCVRFNGADGTIGNCPTVTIGCMAEVTTKWTFSPVTPFIGAIIGSKVITSTSKQHIESPCTGRCPIP
ncbi:MAG TPA: TadE/TadG family type IV pilus assembly protein [Candidatus Limnocylindria bacterium]|jgi:Flp pilus assembly protein TadG|nr:TadE/TadG family type IV pilus assembly protein [Candidatus Limnocylindria bacterium]